MSSFENIRKLLDETEEDLNQGGAYLPPGSEWAQSLLDLIQPQYAVSVNDTPVGIEMNDTTPVPILPLETVLFDQEGWSINQATGVITRTAPGVVRLTAQVKATFTNNTIELIWENSLSARTFSTVLPVRGGGAQESAGQVTALYDIGSDPADFRLLGKTETSTESVTLNSVYLIAEYIPLIDAPTSPARDLGNL